MKNLDKTGNAVFSLNFHFITVVKYRKKIFTNPEIIKDLKDCIEKVAEDFDVTIIEQECDDDHIHVLFKCKPTLVLTKFINIVKGYSSRKIREKHKDFLRDKLWGDSFWSPSYFLSTTGNVSLSVLKRYVQSQKSDGE